MSKRDFNDFQPTQIDRRLGGLLVAAMVAVLIGTGVEATQGLAMVGATPQPATALPTTPPTTLAATAPSLPVQTALASVATPR